MSAVFGHGRLRLYLLRLLADGPRHGYELVRLLERQFLGRYAPSAGTIYPRLQRMELDGLITHVSTGGRKVYEITAAGQAEVTARADELTAIEAEIATHIHASVSVSPASADLPPASAADSPPAAAGHEPPNRTRSGPRRSRSFGGPFGGPIDGWPDQWPGQCCGSGHARLDR